MPIQLAEGYKGTPQIFGGLTMAGVRVSRRQPGTPIVLSHNRILVAHGLLHQEDGGLSLFESIPPGPEGVRVALEAGVVPLGARQRQGRGHVRIILGVCHVTCALAPTRGLCTHDAVRVALGAQLDVVVVRVEAQSGRAREARLSCVFQRDMEQWVLEVKANRIGGAVLREWVSRGTCWSVMTRFQAASASFAGCGRQGEGLG